MKSYIHLIRHGITKGNVEGWFYGAMDVPLADEGIAELKKFTSSGIYPTSGEALFYTSGMLRTEQTLSLIYGDTPHTKLEDLKEMNFGDLEGTPFEQMKANSFFRSWNEDASGELCFPGGGDSSNSFCLRTRRGFNDVKTKHLLKVIEYRNQEKTANSIVICHGGVIGSIMHSVFPEVKSTMWQWVPAPGRGYSLTLHEAGIIDYESI